MNATYKPTKYELPLFFITVKTFVSYSIMTDFVVQTETSELISGSPTNIVKLESRLGASTFYDQLAILMLR